MPDLAIRTQATPALAIDRLNYAYPNATQPALKDVSLHLAPGEFALLAGRSASGKSTLLRAACGLVPHFHGGEIEGRIEVAGIDAIAHGPGELAAAVGYVAQDPETQVVSTTVAAEIELPLEMRGDQPSSRSRGSPGHPPAAGPSRRADLAIGPRRRRRADLAPAPPKRGVGSNDPPRGAPLGALSSRRRPSNRHDLGLDLLRWESPRLPNLGAGSRRSSGDARRQVVLSLRHRASPGRGPRCAPNPPHP